MEPVQWTSHYFTEWGQHAFCLWSKYRGKFHRKNHQTDKNGVKEPQQPAIGEKISLYKEKLVNLTKVGGSVNTWKYRARWRVGLSDSKFVNWLKVFWMECWNIHVYKRLFLRNMGRNCVNVISILFFNLKQVVLFFLTKIYALVLVLIVQLSIVASMNEWFVSPDAGHAFRNTTHNSNVSHPCCWQTISWWVSEVLNWSFVCMFICLFEGGKERREGGRKVKGRKKR